MQTIERDDAGVAVSFDHFGQEIRYYWSKLPDGVVFLALLAAWCLLFHFFGWSSAIAGKTNSLFDWMWDKWTDPANDASHGKIIPWVVLGLLWLRRQRLVKSVAGVWWPALVGLAFALMLHVLGFIVQQPRVSMVALFSGAWILTGLVWGWQTLKVTFFPFLIFAFCVPLGGTFAQGLTLPLRVDAAKATAFITGTLLDVPVTRIGTKLMDPNGVYGSFDVAAECSGIRSLVALLAITIIFSVLTMNKAWKRVVMIASAIPLALICNIMRVTTIILAANAAKNVAAGQFVDSYFGYVTYGVAIGGVLLLGRLLREKPPVRPP
jgi:exosortase